MDTCRTCLVQRKNLRSIFQSSGVLSYIEMINNIVNSKIGHNDGYSNKICLACCRRTQDAYEFKKLVEESQLKLTFNKNDQTNSKNVKKINFDSISDINFGATLSDSINSEKTEPEWNIKLENDTLNYCDTTIKKSSYSRKENNEYINNLFAEDTTENANQLSVEDLLKTIKEEHFDADNDYLDEYDNNNDDDYIPSSSTISFLKESGKEKYVFEKAKHKGKKKAKKKRIGVLAEKNDLDKIVPVILNDVRLVPAKPRLIKPRGPRKNKKVLEKMMVCPYCGKISKHIKTHLLLHTSEKSFKCDQCPKAFYTMKHLEYHQKIHSEMRQFKCDDCTATFNQKSALQSHVLSHTNVRQHVCEICTKGFKRKNALSRHMLRHSSANKTQKCELCNMSFFDKGQLRHHMRVHTGERPYNCEICSQPYSYKHDFNRHCYKKHGVFLKRRSVYVMNHEVLQKERALMKEVVLRARGVVSDGKPANPFEGPQAAQAYQQALQALQNRQLHIDF